MKKVSKNSKAKEVTNKQVLKAVDDLARMTARGFTEAAEDLRGVKKDISAMKINLYSIKHEVGEIKQVIGPLVQIVGAQMRDHNDLKDRVSHLEKLAGVER